MMTFVAFDEYTLMLPPTTGTIAMFDVIEPSSAFRVDTIGWLVP